MQTLPCLPTCTHTHTHTYIHTYILQVVDSTQDGKTGEIVTVHADAPMPTSSRKGGAAAKRRVKVIVDVREFRSALPSLLHKKGMEVVPITLQVCTLIFIMIVFFLALKKNYIDTER